MQLLLLISAQQRKKGRKGQQETETEKKKQEMRKVRGLDCSPPAVSPPVFKPANTLLSHHMLNMALLEVLVKNWLIYILKKSSFRRKRNAETSVPSSLVCV